MPDALFFFHEDPAEAERLGEPFRGRWDVHWAEPDSAALDTIAQLQPMAVVFCLDRCHVEPPKRLARALMDDHRMARPLIVFITGSKDQAEAIKPEVPYGVFVHEDELPWVLKHLTAKM